MLILIPILRQEQLDVRVFAEVRLMRADVDHREQPIEFALDALLQRVGSW